MVNMNKGIYKIIQPHKSGKLHVQGPMNRSEVLLLLTNIQSISLLMEKRLTTSPWYSSPNRAHQGCINLKSWGIERYKQMYMQLGVCQKIGMKSDLGLLCEIG